MKDTITTLQNLRLDAVIRMCPQRIILYAAGIFTNSGSPNETVEIRKIPTRSNKMRSD